MDSFKESFAFWATILGTVVALFGIIQSSGWLIGIAVLLISVSIIAILYARRQRQIVQLATITVEGRSIDSLNVANLRRRLNRSLVIQDAQQFARIEGEDLGIIWEYAGYCQADRETAIEFSIDSDNNVPFDDLTCFAYDLINDPGKNHKIRPILVGPDGTSKKIEVPFLQELTARQPFRVLLTCELPGCMKTGLEYYSATLSFSQKQVQHHSVRLVFAGHRPQWLRVYECDPSGGTTLLKDLQPVREGQEVTEYLDTAENIVAQSARIYLFRRRGITL